jgi:hypothetical protein
MLFHFTDFSLLVRLPVQVFLHAKCVCALQYIYLHVMVTFTSTCCSCNGHNPFPMSPHFLAEDSISHDME